MPATSLLNIDINKLFEENSISEIKTTQTKLQAENERKRVELRTLVGERYRDLIDAADTISDMKVTADGVIGHIEKMSAKCQELQHQHLIGFKLDSDQTVPVPSQNITNKSYYAIGIQIKILIDMPEQIWCAVEKEEFLLGTQLFLFARHINTGLQLHTGGEKSEGSLTGKFPIVSRQWSAISHFREALLDRCQSKLLSSNLTENEASSCLCSLALLQGIGSEELLDTFLRLRTTAVEKVLRSEQHVSGGVRSRICASLQLTIQTIAILHSNFIGKSESEESLPEGLIWKQLKSVVGRDAPPTVALLDLKNDLAAKFLPSNIQDFRPSTSARVTPVAPGTMRERVTAWLGRMERFVATEVSSRLLAVATVRGLQAIRDEAVSVASPTDGWDLVCQQLMIPRGLNLWQSYYQPLVTRRVEDIVKQNWSSIIDQLIKSLSVAIQELQDDKTSREHSEVDLRWFVWSEWASDLPLGSARSDQSRVLGLSMKAKGYSPRVETLCAGFDVQLGALLADLKHYLGADDRLELTTAGINKFEDKKTIQSHLQTCTVDSITRLVEHVRRECSERGGESCPILLARFLQAAPDLCTNLEQCLVDGGGHLQDAARWQQLVGLLRRESLATWQLWRRSISTRFVALINDKLGDKSRLADLLHTIPQWDVVSIEEEGEEGNSVRSDIRVPSQPSFHLQALLHAVCNEVNALVPHTLPATIHQELIEHLVGAMFDHYDATTTSDAVNQSRALQMSLDVKYITALLVPRDNKILMSQSQEISDKIEDRVDPFDLDVFTPYIQNNIKRSVQRTQCLLGVLIAWPEKLATAGLRATAKQATIEDPNVLPLCTGSQWFPLLPVSGPPGQRSASARITDVAQRKTTSSPKAKVDSTPTETVRSGAAAFFGAMSSDWFGS